MIDITEIIDNGTNFPTTWKTLVRELLLKFEDGATYHHTNIAGCRPYTIDLTIKLDECVDEAEDTQLHKEAKKREYLGYVFSAIYDRNIDRIIEKSCYGHLERLPRLLYRSKPTKPKR